MTEEQFLVPLEKYLKVGIHIGTKMRTKHMVPFIYKVRPDGLAVLNIQEIDKRIRVAINFLAQFEPKDILVVCRRENGWKSVKMFSKFTEIRVITGRYPPGLLTNPNLENFTEAKLLLVTDPWPDKNAVNDASRIGIEKRSRRFVKRPYEKIKCNFFFFSFFMKIVLIKFNNIL